MKFAQVGRLFAVNTESDAEQKSIEALLASTTQAPTPAPTPSPMPKPSSTIDTADIVCSARADIPFAQQNWWAQAYGNDLHTKGDKLLLPETGIHGSKLPNGETMRFGKAVAQDGKYALVFQLAPGDPIQNGSHRSELELMPLDSVNGKNIEHEKTYWFAYRMWIDDWGKLPPEDQCFIGLHIHGGASQWDGTSGPHGLVVYANEDGGRSFRVWTAYTTPQEPKVASGKMVDKGELIPIPFGRWVDFVGKFNQSQTKGFFQMWMDGKLIADRGTPFGLYTPGVKDYMKAGFYNWSGTDRVKKVMLRNVVVAQDPGGKYSQEAPRAYLSQ